MLNGLIIVIDWQPVLLAEYNYCKKLDAWLLIDHPINSAVAMLI